MATRRALDLRGRVVVVTGASRGLGFAVARAFSDRGARLAICARDPVHLDGARRELEAGGAEVLAQPCDVADAAAVEQFVAAVVARGLVAYNRTELGRLLGRSTRELVAELGPGYDREVIHRDSLVVVA